MPYPLRPFAPRPEPGSPPRRDGISGSVEVPTSSRHRDQTGSADNRGEQHSPDTDEVAENELADEPENRRDENGELAEADNARHEPTWRGTKKVTEVGCELAVVGAVQRRIHERDDHERPKKPDRSDGRSHIRRLVWLQHHERWSRRRDVKHGG